MFLRITLVLTLLLTSLLLGQSGGTLEVKSDPPGTVINLEGELKLAGITPTVFTQSLTGLYVLKASREGYESYQTKLVMTGGSPLVVNITLTPKTRFKAFMRSAVIPGWGQFYAGEKTRGVFMGITALAVGVTVLVIHGDYVSKGDDYDDWLSKYNEERSIEKRIEMEDDVDAARESAYDAESSRNISASVFAAVWLYNLLDAVVFFPDKTYKAYSPRVSIDTGQDFSKIGLALNFRF